MPGDGSWLVFCAYRSTCPGSVAPGHGLARWWMLKEYARAGWREEEARDVLLGRQRCWVVPLTAGEPEEVDDG